jgi:predicted permease
MRSILDDVIVSVRLLLKNKAYSAGILILFALGIGANSTIFSLTDAVLFRDLSVARPAELVRLYTTDEARRELSESSFPAFREYQQETSVFSGMAAWSGDVAFHLSTDASTPQRVTGAMVSGNYFQVLGVGAESGRMFLREDDRPGTPGRVVILSDRLWRSRFGASPGVVGSPVRLNTALFTVVGVAPPGFQGASFEETPDLWVPLADVDAAAPEMKELRPLERRGIRWLMAVGRLRSGVTIQQAQSRLDAAARARLTMQPQEEGRFFVRLLPARAAALDPSRGPDAARLSWLLLGAVAFVLLIACADAAGLFMVRADRRRQEMAIRTALGASRLRLARLLLTEGMLLSLGGGGLGIMLAGTATDFIVSRSPAAFDLPLLSSTPVFSLRVLGFAFLASGITALVFAAGPLLRISQVDPVAALKGPGGWMRVGGARLPLRSSLVALQVALSVVLLVGAGLTIRTLSNAGAVSSGFDPDGAVTAELDLSRQGYDRPEGRRLYVNLLEQVRGAAGMRGAALASSVPIRRGGMSGNVELEGYAPAKGESPMADLNIVTPGYFSVLGSSLLRGRDFTPRDRADGTLVVIVNRTLADRYWPGQEAVGKRIMNLGPAEVVGVVADVRSRSLREDPRPTVFVPVEQFYSSQMTLLVRTSLPRAAAERTLAEAVRRIDATLPLFKVRSLRERLDSALDRERVLAWLFSAFAALALLLSVAGLYSVVACSVQDRSREWGIRTALGARPGDLFRLVQREGFRMALSGLALGLPASWFLSRSMSHFLFGVLPGDPLTYALAAAALLVSALLGCALPARRAAGQDPMASLRDE